MIFILNFNEIFSKINEKFSKFKNFLVSFSETYSEYHEDFSQF